jgi:acyl-CoA synthetase (AMP-forming)/AMP-acid ligase II
MTASDVWEAFQATVARHPDRPAVTLGDSGLTFAQLEVRAAVIGGWMVRRGIRPGDRVIVWVTTRPETAAVLLGIWAAGAVAVLMDAGEKGAHLDHAIRTVGPVLLVKDPASQLPAIEAAIEVVDAEGMEGPAAAPAKRRLPTEPASIVFTSGSTGRPKGVTQPHGNLLRACAAVGRYLGYGADERILSAIPWAFDYGYGHLLTTLVHGSSLYLPKAINGFGICEAIDRHKPTVFPGLPSIFGYLLRGVAPFARTDVSTIRIVTNTGGTIAGPILEDALRAFHRARFFLNYGLTETYRTAFLPPEKAAIKPTSIGKGIPGVEVVVVREDGTRCDAGEEGEIVHRGDYVMLGYWNNPDATAKALRADPFATPGAPHPRPVLYTGDFGVIDDEGDLYFRGRRDHQIKSMDVRVTPAEVEAHLHRSGLVREVGVFGVPHPLLGDEVWAVVEAEGDPAAVRRELLAYARGAMSAYMVPRRIEFVPELPRTRTGKIDYPALKAFAATRPSAQLK